MKSLPSPSPSQVTPTSDISVDTKIALECDRLWNEGYVYGLAQAINVINQSGSKQTAHDTLTRIYNRLAALKIEKPTPTGRYSLRRIKSYLNPVKPIGDDDGYP